ncbi:SCN10A [Symbiodinium sp. KB8]|nr:SCN10A [Symbiodinium sp. KB8]
MLNGVLDATEDIQCERGMSMISRLYPGGLFFAMPFRSGRDKPQLEKVMGFLINMVVFCKMISARCLIQLPYDLWETFRQHPRTQEVWEPLEMMKETITMASFGGRSQNPMVLVGHDRFVISCMRYMAAQFRSLSTRRLGGFRNGKGDNGLPGTFIYALVDLVMLRYRRDWEDFVPRNLGRLLNRIVHNLLAQDLDEILVGHARHHDVMFPKTRVFDMEFQAPPPVVMTTDGVPYVCDLTIDVLPGLCHHDYSIGSCASQHRRQWAMVKTEAKSGLRRTMSTRSMTSAPPEPEDVPEPNARSFLLGTAKRSLDEAFGVEKPSAEKEKKKKGDKKKEKAKKKKKGKKSSSSSQSSSQEESESEPSQDGFEDAAATFGLGKRDMARSMEVATLVELDARPTALVLSKITPLVIANDIFEMGGELAESLLRDRSLTAKKNRAKKEQEDALFQMKTAAAVWKRRKFPGGKDAWGKALEEMLTHAREVLLLLFCCCCQLLFLSATQAASDDLKQQMKQIDKPKKPHGRVPKEAKKTKAREPEAEVSEKDEPEESIPSPTGAPYMESVSEPEQEDEDNDVFQGPFKLPAEKEGLDAVLAKLPPKIKGVADGFERAVLEADFSYWLLCLEKEALTETEHFKLGLAGTSLDTIATHSTRRAQVLSGSFPV